MPAAIRSQLHRDEYHIASDWATLRCETLLPAHNCTAGAPVQLLLRPWAGSAPTLHEVIAACRPWLEFEHDSVARLHDIWVTDSHLGLIYESREGLSLFEATAGGRKILEAKQALGIVHDAIQGLIALGRAGLRHGNLCPQHILVTPQRRFVLVAPLPPAVDAWTVPGQCLGEQRLHYLAPERIADPGTGGIGADCFALGVVLYSLLCTNPLLVASSREELLGKLAAGDYLDCAVQLANHREAVIDIVSCCLSREPASRYANANDLRHDCSLAMVDCQAERAARISRLEPDLARRSGGLAARSSAAIEATEIQAHLAAYSPLSSPAASGSAPLAGPLSGRMAKLVKISDDRLQARIKLGPGVRVAEATLRQILAMEHVVHGIQESALLKAATPRDRIRKIVLAQGTRPEPGRPGIDVFGGILPPLAADIVIEVAEDRMTATALVPANKPVPAEKIREALLAAEVVRGLDKEVIGELTRIGSETGREIIARGQAVQHGLAAAFKFCDDVAKLAEHGEPLLVYKGTRFARWDIPRLGCDGFDVTGRPIPSQLPEGLEQGLVAGPGCRIEHREADVYLAAELAGVVGVTTEGIFQVKEVRQIPGGLAGDAEIDCDAVLVIQGSVADGAVIRCSGDVCILGDLGDANVVVGGRLTVMGRILPGEQQIAAQGDVEAASIQQRHVVGDAITVGGLIEHAELVARGTITAQAAVGGRLTAAGDFRLREVGNEAGEPTRLWAGYHVPKAVARELAQLQVRRAAQDRELMLKEREVFRRIIEQIEHKNYMQHVLGYMASDYKKNMLSRYQQVQRRLQSLQDTMAGNQDELSELRQEEQELDQQVVDHDVEINIEGTLHVGVEIKIADTHTRRIETRQDDLRLSL